LALNGAKTVWGARRVRGLAAARLVWRGLKTTSVCSLNVTPV